MAETEWRDRYYEDFSVGDRCRHRNSRTVSNYDNLLFTLLSQNPAPLHLNHHYATEMGHKRIPLNSTLTLALVTGQSVADLTPNVITNLGWNEIRLPAPAYEGDTIYSESVIVKLRESAKHQHAGIMAIHTIGYTQDGTIVIDFVRNVMIYRRGHAPVVSRPEPHGTRDL